MVEYCWIELASVAVGMWSRTIITCTLDDEEYRDEALTKAGSTYGVALAGWMLEVVIVVASDRISSTVASDNILFMERLAITS